MAVLTLLLGLAACWIALSVTRALTAKSLPKFRALDLRTPGTSGSQPPLPLLALWASGRAVRPTVDLADLGPPPQVEGELSLSQALEELRSED